MHSDAKFVLVVEKEASFQRLMDDNVLQKLNPCIVITVSIYIEIFVVVVVVFAFLLSLCSLLFWALLGIDFVTFFLNLTTLQYNARNKRDYSLLRFVLRWL